MAHVHNHSENRGAIYLEVVLARSPSSMRTALYKWYLLLVLLTVLTFSNMDGLVLGLLSQSIKLDFGLTDTQVGLLSGMAFALFYSVMGIPIARWADRGDRVVVMSVSTAVWCVLVAACGWATNFAQLLVIRVGVAVGEAGCVPPAHSLIAQYFERVDRARAVGIYMLGGSLSMLIGYFAAGWLNELYGWRATFEILGASALLPTVLVWLTLEEPRRAKWKSSEVSRSQTWQPEHTSRDSIWRVCLALWRIRTFRHLVVCYSVVYFFGYGMQQWQPAFFIRSFGLTTGALGTWFAAIFGTASFVGTYLGGDLASRFTKNDEATQLKATSFGYVAFGVISALAYLSHDVYWAFGLIGLAGIGAAATTGPMLAVLQTLVPERMRATSIALIYLLANLIGMGLGPLAAGALSDELSRFVGSESLRYAMVALCPGQLWAAWHCWQASKTVMLDVELTETALCGRIVYSNSECASHS